MSGLLDVNAAINRIIADFPGNYELQQTLGVPDVGQPCQSLSDIPWHSLDAIGLMRIIVAKNNDEVPMGTAGNTAKLHDIRNNVIKISNRILIMEMILKSGYRVKDIDNKMLDLFIELSLPAYYNQLNELTINLAQALIEEQEACEKLEDLLSR